MKDPLILVSFLFSSSFIHSQIPVRFEPRHKVALENAYIRLLDVRLAPGDTSLFHIHEIPSFFIPLSTTAVGSQVKGEEEKESRFAADSTWYSGFETGPLIHRVWNRDSSVMHVIDLELLSRTLSVLPPAPELATLKIDFENDKLRVYKFELSSNTHLRLPLLKTPMLFISVAGPVVRISQADEKRASHEVRAGAFQWLPANQKFQITNNETTAVNAILILLK